MTHLRSPETVSGCRVEAQRLLKELRGADPERAHAAAARFARLRSLADGGPAAVLARRARVRLKHALSVIAVELGAASWLELKRALEAPPAFHTPRLGTLLNRWFREHAEALRALEEHGGYLLPFGVQCFVTESEGIRELGLDPADPDWSAVGFDLVRPRDSAAYARLCAKRRAAIAAGLGPPTEARRRR